MSELETSPVSRRNMELLLLLLALLVSMGAYYLVGVNSDQGLSEDFITQGLFLAGLSLVFHVVLRIWAKYADPVILPVAVALNGIGLAMIHRIDLAKISNDSNQSGRQILWTGLSMVIAMVALWAIRDHRILRRFTYIALAASIVLLLLPMIPGFGKPINGARIWVQIGGSLSFQPGELAKITLAIFFAGYLSANRELILLAGKKLGPLQLPRARDLGPMVVAWLVSIGVLIIQRDLGSSILFFGLFIVMIYVATARVSWVVIGMSFVAVGGIFAYFTMSHVTRRIDGWINAFDPDVYNAKYGSRQIVEGLFGLANGGLVGTGLGNGTPYMVPLANSDMIVASLGEELGLIGLTAIVLLFLILVSRGMRAALGSRDSFGKLLAAGFSFTIGLQCFVVIGGVTRLIPLTGLTTPFMAAGGSSLLSNWIIVALLLLISHNSRRPMTAGISATAEVATEAPDQSRGLLSARKESQR